MRAVVLRSALSPWTGRRRYRAVMAPAGAPPAPRGDDAFEYVLVAVRLRVNCALPGRASWAFAIDADASCMPVVHAVGDVTRVEARARAAEATAAA